MSKEPNSNRRGKKNKIGENCQINNVRLRRRVNGRTVWNHFCASGERIILVINCPTLISLCKFCTGVNDVEFNLGCRSKSGKQKHTLLQEMVVKQKHLLNWLILLRTFIIFLQYVQLKMFIMLFRSRLYVELTFSSHAS